MRTYLLLVLVFALASQSLFAEGDTWPRFRGGDGAGLGEGLKFPVPWSGKDVRWTVELPGRGHASPVVWKGKVFVTAGDAATAARRLLCLDAADGKTLWQREFGSAAHRIHKDNSYASSTPAVNADAVFLYWSTPEEVVVAALDHGGRELWRRSLGAFASQHGSGASPVCFEDLVIVPNDQDADAAIVALDAKTGRDRWQARRSGKKTAYATPVVLRRSGKPPELVFSSTSHGVTSLDPRTGAVNWEFADAFPQRVVGSLTVAAGLVVGTSGEGGIGRRLVAVTPPASGKDGELAFEMKSGIPYVPTPIAVGDLLFLWGDRGVLTCLRPPSIEKVWEEKLGANFYGSPVSADGRIFCMAKDGTVFVVAARDKFELLGTVPLGEPSFATPAIAGGILYLRTESHLTAVGGKGP